MKIILCGVCNEPVPEDKAVIMKVENKEAVTSYHLRCESKIPKHPCSDCNKHRLFCNECKE